MPLLPWHFTHTPPLAYTASGWVVVLKLLLCGSAMPWHAVQKELQGRVSELEQQLQSALSDPNSTAAQLLYSTLLAVQPSNAEPTAAVAAVPQADEPQSKQQAEHKQAGPEIAAEKEEEDAQEVSNAPHKATDALAVSFGSQGKGSSERKRSARRRKESRVLIEPALGQPQSPTCF